MTATDVEGRAAGADAAPAATAHRRRELPSWANQRAGLLVAIVALVTVFGVARPVFFDQQLSLFGLLRDISIYTVVGLSQMAVLSIGHMNLAVGRMAAVSALVIGFAYEELRLPLLGGLALGLAAGAAIGALAGWTVLRTGVHSFIVTLALDFMLVGLVALAYTGLTESAAFTTRPEALNDLRNGSLADVCAAGVCGPPAVPLMLVLTIVVMAAVWFLFARMRVGRELLVLGSNERAARLSGVATGRRIVFAHLLSGLLAGLAGFMLAATTGSFRADIGNEFMLPSFLGPVLGGTLLAGGFVSVLGTFLGTALTSVIRQGLVLLQVGLESLNIYLGLILLVAISTERIRSALSRVSAVDSAGGAAAAQELRGGRRRFRSSSEATLLAIAVVGFALLTFKSDGNLLLDGNARSTFFAFLSVPVLIGLAQLVVLAVGQMNLAVGALGGLLAVATASLMADAGVPLAAAVPIALVLGAAGGAVSGLIVVATRVNGFIVTLAMMTIFLGVQYRIVGTSTITGYSSALQSFGDATIASVPLTFGVALAIAASLAFFLGRTVAGRQLLATGGNPVAARLSGISNDRSIVTAHALSGLIIAVAALVTMASLDNVNTSIGGDWLLPSFAAAIIGGAALTGGSVSVAGTVLAALIIRLVDTGRAEFSLDPSWVSFVVGAVVLGTVLVGRMRAVAQLRAGGARR